MVTVRLDNPYNSTHFTTCCGVAVMEYDETCPGCGEKVYPFVKGNPHETKVARCKSVQRWWEQQP